MLRTDRHPVGPVFIVPLVERGVAMDNRTSAAWLLQPMVVTAARL